MYYNDVANRFASGQRITFLGRVMQRGSEKERKELTNEESNKKGIVGLYKEEQYASILCKRVGLRLKGIYYKSYG